MTLLHADGSDVAVQWGATTEMATGRRLVLVVVLSTSRWGSRFRPAEQPEREDAALSRRELEVVRLVADGLTNREIAAELFLSPRTVDMHVRNILSKLDCRSRVEASIKAGEAGLLRVPGSSGR